jgi:ppGpp synthetase/RelA/SpoT-type nucleotidyltranferase
MPGIADSAEAFPAEYAHLLPQLHKAAQQAEILVASLLMEFQGEIHLISARAKSPDSALSKVLRKAYKNPIKELTDCIGVRVIAYHESEIDKIVDRLSSQFDIDSKNSVDRRRALDLRSFGYRSVHLIARLKGFRASSPEYAELRGRWFEIQIRSILEHAWAEIEHEVVYKSGIDYPADVLRRFAAIAGTLELIEKEFRGLRAERGNLIDGYRDVYKKRKTKREVLDTARLLGLMEAEWPRNLSWRSAELSGKPFPAKIEDRCIAALKELRLCRVDLVRRRFHSATFKRALRKFAYLETLSHDDVSHLALILLVIALQSPKIFKVYFPGMTDNPSIKQAIQTGRRRRPLKKRRLGRVRRRALRNS